jgi:tyrosyl-tRNA synthetase
MGKSEGGALYLDPELTTPYEFYQFFVNSADDDVVPYLKLLTFRTQDEIAELVHSVKETPFKREAQKALASDLTTLIHGADATRAVEFASQALFGRGDLRDLDAVTLRGATAELASVKVSVGSEIVDAFVGAGLAKSRGEARRAIADGGAYVNNVKIASEDQVFEGADLLHGTHAVLRRGKKTLAVAEIG